MFHKNEEEKLKGIEALKEALGNWLAFIEKHMQRNSWIQCAGMKPTIADFCVAHFYFNFANNSAADTHTKVAVEYTFKRFENVEKAMLYLAGNK